MKTQSLSPRHQAAFEDLLNRLSPENLTQDGERSPRRVAEVQHCLVEQWKALEGRVGRVVSDTEVFRNASRRNGA